MLYREAVLAFLGYGEGKNTVDTYCEQCRILKEDDCENCDKAQIKVFDGQ